MCKKSFVLVIALLFVICTGTAMAQALTDEEELGKLIFFDQNLSINGNQSCAACHGPAAGWTGPETDINAGGAVYEGSIPGRFGNRKPPSSAYATPSPILHFVIEKKEALFIGGNFWDGRATGEKLGNPASDQAQGPYSRTTLRMRMRTWASRRFPPCTTSARVPVKARSRILIASTKPMHTTATSRASRASCT